MDGPFYGPTWGAWPSKAVMSKFQPPELRWKTEQFVVWFNLLGLFLCHREAIQEGFLMLFWDGYSRLPWEREPVPCYKRRKRKEGGIQEGSWAQESFKDAESVCQKGHMCVCVCVKHASC